MLRTAPAYCRHIGYDSGMTCDQFSADTDDSLVRVIARPRYFASRDDTAVEVIVGFPGDESSNTMIVTMEEARLIAQGLVAVIR